MDLADDILMQDGEITVATERIVEVDGSDAASPRLATQASGTKPSGYPLKAGGVKRDTSVHDHHLTAREDDPRPAKFAPLPYATSQTGLVYDVRMRFHVEVTTSDTDLHPEDPRRIHAIFESFVAAGLAWKKGLPGSPSDYYMGRIDTRKVTKEECLLVHTEAHWDWVQQLKDKTDEELEEEQQYPDHKLDSVYMSPSTPFCAALSAGGAIEACRAVLLGRVKNIFAVVRPPGHHAEREDAKGFCFFDNVSIATKACQREFGEKCRKVFILDWDVHHGNGIQQANYDDPNVLYVSLHRGNFYPEKSYRDGRRNYNDIFRCGTGAGIGKNVNIPWSKSGMGDAEYIYAFQQAVMPIATEFDPDLVIIAAGFDAAQGDMIGGCNVTPAAYAHMTHMLMSLADGRLAVCLEGGYNLESIARSATAVARTMMGEPPGRLEDTAPAASAVDDVKKVVRQQSRFWSSLHPKDPSARLSGTVHGERMHDVVRKWQSGTMWDEYEMLPLFVHRDSLSKSFENQILATPNYVEERPLLVILHDPPEMIASPDPRTGKVELHNTWLTDVMKTYVDWAVAHNFAVIDVNLPKHITDPGAAQEHSEIDTVENRTKEAQQLLSYLWDNYIEPNDATHTFLLGTNTGHGALINFIKANEHRATSRLTSAISFVEDVPLQSCKSSTSDDLAPWYHAASLVFVAHDHNFWASELSRKPRKRFGRVVQSVGDSVSDMLLEHKQVVFDALLERTAEWRNSARLRAHVDGADDEDGAMEVTELGGMKKPPFGNLASAAASRTLSARNSPSMAPGSGNVSAARTPPAGNFAPSPEPPRGSDS